MSIPEALLSEIRGLRRKPSEWFSIEDIKKQDRDLEIAGRYIIKGTNKALVIARKQKEIYEKLEDWAARLLERELRLYEYSLWQLCSEHSAIPSIQDDKVLVETASEYMTSSVEELKEMISSFCGYKPDEFFGGRSRLNDTSTKLDAEMLVTIPLAAEISRLEMLDTGHGALDRLGHAQIRMERFFSKTYATIPHPFSDEKLLILSPTDLKQAIRLITYVVFKTVDELRLAGFEEKFVNVFLRYLSCSRESSAPVVEQITALFEPFLKKLCFVFDRKGSKGKPLWPFSLDGLIVGLNLSQADLKKTDRTYWQRRSVQDGTLRLAYQLRHMSAHEAHQYPYFENERHGYFIFAAIVLSCATVLQANPDIRKVVEHQETADLLRDFFVRIEDLLYGPDGPRLSSTPQLPPTRLQKLISLGGRAQAIWPNCSVRLSELLESEYDSVRSELIEADREADIESFIDSMRPDDY